MNYNILCYFIYGIITIYIIVWVGKLFHTNGRIFILRLFSGNEKLADTTNNLLLLAYYLFNIGYAVLQFNYWENVANLTSMIDTISLKMGLLIIILSVTHYLNMFLIYFLSNKALKHSSFKNIQS